MKRLFVAIMVALVFCGGMSALAESTPITLNDSGIVCDAPGTRVNGSTLTITAPGEYNVTGFLSQGQIVVNSEEEGKITLTLDNVSIYNDVGPAIYVRQCRPRLSILLAEGSSNTLSTGENYQFENKDEPNGVIFSKADLTLTGTGALNIASGCMDGIVSKDDLRIKGGQISVTAPRNGIRGKDGVEIYDGTINVTAGNDGIKSTNKDNTERGYVEISGGTITITCGDEPVSAVTRFSMTGGSLVSTITGVEEE